MRIVVTPGRCWRGAVVIMMGGCWALAEATVAAKPKQVIPHVVAADDLTEKGCFAWSPKRQTLLCRATEEFVAGTRVDLVTVRVRGGLKERRLLASERTDEAQREAVTKRLNSRLAKRGFETIKPWSQGSDLPRRAGKVLIRRTKTHLEFVRGKTVVGSVSLKAADPESFPDPPSMTIYAPAPQSYVVMLDHNQGDEGMVHQTRIEVVHAAPMPKVSWKEHKKAAGCPASAECPKDYAWLYEPLEALCRADESKLKTLIGGLESLVRQRKVDPASLRYLFNAPAPMYGYTFKKATELNRFYYGQSGVPPTWLPPACQSRYKARLSSRSEVPAAASKAAGLVRKLYRQLGM